MTAPSKHPAPSPEPDDATKPRRHFRNLLRWLCIAYAVGAVSHFLIIRYLGDRWWPATLLLFAPRWPLILPMGLLVPLCMRRKKLIWLPLMTGVFVVGPILGYHIPWRRAIAPPPKGAVVRVLICNVHQEELDLGAMDRYIVSADPQIILFQDWSEVDDVPALRAPGWYTYQVGEIFLATRFPILRVIDLHLEKIKGVDDIDIWRRNGIAACYDIQTPDGVIHIVNVHLSSPHTSISTIKARPGEGIWKLKANSIRRRNESIAVTQWLATQHGPLVIAGDFNTPAESPIYREYWAGYPDAFRIAGFGYGYTHLSPKSELRIDHLLMGGGVSCIDCKVGPSCGSPHRPILADLVLDPEK
jgi:vancomycin resistance protein VanJ